MPPYPYDHQFRKLMDLAAEGAQDELFAELIRAGSVIHQPLIDFLMKGDHGPEVVVLLELLGKSLGGRGVPTLLHFLEHRDPRVRLGAIRALGWVRGRVALPMLDRMEVEDPDDKVRREARAAIEEILKEWPGLAGTLVNHRPKVTGTGAGSLPEPGRLSALLPRLLAVKFSAIPLGFDSTGPKVRLAVASGQERRLIGPLESVTGFNVELVAWPLSRVRAAIDSHYTLGDDDFLDFGESLTPNARALLLDEVLSGIRADEPGAPIAEAMDVIEGFQLLVAESVRRNLPTIGVRQRSGNVEALIGDECVCSSSDASWIERSCRLMEWMLSIQEELPERELHSKDATPRLTLRVERAGHEAGTYLVRIVDTL